MDNVLLIFMSFASDVAGIFKKDWKLFLASNAALFGLFILGVLAGVAFPGLHDSLVSFIQQATSEGPIGAAESTLKAGDIASGTWLIFSHNYAITIIVGAIPSLIFPPWILLFFGAQFFVFGVVYSFPASLANPALLVPLIGTLLLEGEGYVIAIFAALRLAEALIWPGRFGERSAAGAYVRAVIDNGKLLLVAGAVLAVAAFFEAASIVLVMGY